MSQSLVTPSFAQGYAPRDGASSSPSLRRGLKREYVPALGITGARLMDVGHGHVNATHNGTWAGCGLVLSDTANQFATAATWPNVAARGSIAFRVCIDDTATKWITTHFFSGGGNRIYFGTDSTWKWRLGTSAENDTGIARVIGEDVSCVLTWDGTTGRFYYGGSLKDSNAYAGLIAVTLPLDIGRISASVTSGFTLRSLYIWDRAITASEARELNRNHLAPSEMTDRLLSVRAPAQFFGDRSIGRGVYRGVAQGIG